MLGVMFGPPTHDRACRLLLRHRPNLSLSSQGARISFPGEDGGKKCLYTTPLLPVHKRKERDGAGYEKIYPKNPQSPSNVGRPTELQASLDQRVQESLSVKVSRRLGTNQHVGRQQQQRRPNRHNDQQQAAVQTRQVVPHASVQRYPRGVDILHTTWYLERLEQYVPSTNSDIWQRVAIR